MTKMPRPEDRMKTDAERRKKQAMRFARIIAVSRILSTEDDIPECRAKWIAEKLGVCSRTVYRDIAVIREANRILESFEAE